MSFSFHARLQWFRQVARPNLRYWRRIHFSDESPFKLGKVDGQLNVCRWWNDVHNADCILPTIRSGRVTILVWGYVSCDCKCPLLLLEYRLIGQRCRDEVLAAAVHPHLDTHLFRGPRGSPIFQQYNAPVHTARARQDFLTNSVDVIPWPSGIPDLNISKRHEIFRTDLNCVSKYHKFWKIRAWQHREIQDGPHALA